MPKTRSWDERVSHAELLARSAFRDMRERIVATAALREDEVVVDLGCGTGLLTLALAPHARTVWAIDSSPPMVDYLRVKAQSAELDNVRPVAATIVSVPLVDSVADVVVSNYCFHELPEEAKMVALGEAYRVLRPGGRLVIGDMMFGLSPWDARDRRVVISKVASIGRRGIPGVIRLLKNAMRLASGRWEHPRSAEWWREALRQSGFGEVSVEVLGHEGGIACARRPAAEPTASGPDSIQEDTAAVRPRSLL